MKWLFSFVLFLLAMQIGAMVTYRDPMLQRNFPCNEDEVLAFHVRFGPDKVGCIHLDELTWGQ